ncbi:MAG: radical SAM family heme chaperone HemW [Lentisphaeria bacterium]|nr:radical SAM family heme chaperone HemW [Lentisphaeria bacterium]
MVDHLYIHVPFCASKCAYCAFYSETDAAPAARLAWLDKLAEELHAHAPELARLRTVFIGGGTPTFLPPLELERALASIRAVIPSGGVGEFTIECNPETLTPEKADSLARHGVNRVSLGVQSFSPALRRTLGRGGSAEAAEQAVGLLRNAGIRNYGMDLIYGIPGQRLTDWERDVRHACGTGVSHLSAYALTVEEGTRLARKGAPPPDDELAADMWTVTGECCADYGLARYEISNYALPGKTCRHNQGIWHGQSYLGLGPAASSFDGISRWTQPADLRAWLEDTPPERDELPAPERACEILAFGLRTVEGWNKQDFADLTRFTIRGLRGAAVDDLIRQELLVETDSHVRPTERGLLFADTVAINLV